MSASYLSLNQTLCRIYELSFEQSAVHCNICQKPAACYSTANRTAIDINLAQPILLSIKVGVHYCSDCHHYFRIQPPFLRPGAVYANRVVSKAVESVYHDGMAIRRAANRLARDFWVRPSEAMIRMWCRDYSASYDFQTDYQAWVVSEFSGILCVDEVYQGSLALLLGVDPAAPDGDRLVGYELVHGHVDGACVEGFLHRIKEAGIEPEQVISDGSALYPSVLSKVWPQAAHQLCLFHETRRVTTATMKAIQAIRKAIPSPPPQPGMRGGGALRAFPPSEDPDDPATQRWHWRQAQRGAGIARVQALAAEGLSQRAIARQTGHHRTTIKRWLQRMSAPEATLEAPILSEEIPPTRKERLVRRRKSKKAKREEVHSLRQEGLNYSEIARRVGVHRVTVSKWLQEEFLEYSDELPGTEMTSKTQLPPPPSPWHNWEEVKQVRELLKEHRFLFLRRPAHLTQEEQTLIETLLNSPVGPELQIAYAFLMGWYRLWSDEQGQRRSLEEAKTRFETWRTDANFLTNLVLRRLLERMTEQRFERMSQFLRNPAWEATNNGAERTGRQFRHRQAPHFNLRRAASIENAIVVRACLHKQACQVPASEPFHTCQRGRRRQSDMREHVKPP